MKIKQFIEKAISGGYVGFTWEDVQGGDGADVFLDPLAWKAVGKVCGWTQVAPYNRWGIEAHWYWNMHQMIDALVEGKSLEEFIETL